MCNSCDKLKEYIRTLQADLQGLKAKLVAEASVSRRAKKVLYCRPTDPTPRILYGLADPADPKRIRYVGQSLAPHEKYRAHIRRGAGKIPEWVAELRERDCWPLMVLLGRAPDKTAAAKKEQELIDYYQRRGQADLNTAPAHRDH